MIVYESADDFAGLESTWNRVALRAPRPALTHEWFLAWWRAFGNGKALAVTHQGRASDLLGGAVLVRGSSRTIRAAANEYTDDWDVIAIDDSARASLWCELGRLGAAKLDLPRLPEPGRNLSIATHALAEGDYRVAISRQEMSPYLVLPSTWEELLETVSRNQRSKIRRYRKRLEAESGLTFRTVAESPIDEALGRFFEVEASGWKGAAGTAIVQRPRAHRFYTEFAHAAAAKGWLRLHLLELDGVTIAGAYSCVLGETAFLLKSGFDESQRRLAPGALLRAEALREAISEGLTRFEFMGKAEPHKLHWTPQLRERSLIQAYRGLALPEYAYRHKLRPVGRWVRDLIRPRRE